MIKHSITASRHELHEWLAVLISGLICIVAILITNDVIYHVISILLVCVISVSISGFDLLSPYCSYAIIYTLYSSGYAILLAIGDRTGNYTREPILYSTIGLIVSLLVIGPKKVNDIKYQVGTEERNYKYLDLFVIGLSLLTILCAFILYRRGYSSKRDMQRANDFYYRAGVYLVRYLTIFSMIRISNRALLSLKYNWIIVLSGFASLAFGLLTGERDAFIRLFVCILFVLFTLGVIRKRHFIVLIPVVGFLLGITDIFKYYFLTGVLRGTVSGTSFIERFLSADFTAAGRNLQYLVDHNWTKGYFGLKLLVTELLYPILPSSLTVNPDRWFNTSVHIGGFQGYAFTLVGTGYIMAGVIGIIILFVVIGIFIRFIYNRSSKDNASLTIYIYTITLIMYAMRESLNNIVNSFVKEIIVAMIVLYIMNYLLYTKNKKTK